jgi:hypothetical protein
MAYWIEFESKSHLWLGVQYSTNIVGLPPLVLTQKRGTLSVFSHGKCVAEAMAGNELKFGERLLQPILSEKKLRIFRSLIGLGCNDLRLFFDWSGDTSAVRSGVFVTCDHLPEERYTVRNKIKPFIPRTKTKVRIESDKPPRDLHLMIASLTYFWNYFERDRTHD